MIPINIESLNNTTTFIDVFDKKIGILLNRSIGLISALYNCFNNNITYIPLSTEWPESYLKHIINENGLTSIITNEQYSKIFDGVNTIIVDEKKAINFNCHHKTSEIAYILYTSGTTGVPKGVQIYKNSLLNFIEGISDIIDFSKGKRILCLTNVTFDIFFLESIMSLYLGLEVILAEEHEQRNPKLIAELINDNSIDIIQMTPSMLQIIYDYDNKLLCLKEVKELLVGGEIFPEKLLLALQKNTNAEIYNMYGPTETTIWSTVSNLTNKNHVDIGKPIKNTEIYIMDDNLNELSKGDIGEIYISGKGLSCGYIGLPELTKEKFIFLPQLENAKVYRTGDLGKVLPDGNIEYLGRIDNQVKIRGHRIELEEIECHINSFHGIGNSIVAVDLQNDIKILIAYYTSKDNIDSAALKQFLLHNIPEYMIPSKLVHVKNFKYTLNGKIDRKAVSECERIILSQNTVCNEVVLNDNEKYVYEKLLMIFCEIIKNDECNFSIATKLEEIGLDSLSFVRLIVLIENEFDIEFDDEMLLISSFIDVRSLINYIINKTME